MLIVGTEISGSSFQTKLKVWLSQTLALLALLLGASAAGAANPVAIPGYGISLVAGTGADSNGASGGQAALTAIRKPTKVVLDSSGNLFFLDVTALTVRMVNPSGVLSTVAGGGTGCAGQTDAYGDGCLPTQASFGANWLQALAIDPAGNVYVLDGTNHNIRRITNPTTGTGTITLFGGTVTNNTGTGIGVPMTACPSTTTPPLFNTIPFEGRDMVFDSRGNAYIDTNVANCRNLYKVDATSNRVTLFAGLGASSTSCTSIVSGTTLATAVALGDYEALGIDRNDTLYLVLPTCNAVVKVPTAGPAILTTVAGPLNAARTDAGDGGLALSSALNGPSAVAIDPAGNVFIAEQNAARVREIVAATGRIYTVTGTGAWGAATNNVAALKSQVNQPWGLASDSTGNIFLADQNNHEVRKLTSLSFANTTVGTAKTTTQYLTLAEATALNSTAIKSSSPEFTLGTVALCNQDGATSNLLGSVCSVPVTFTPQFPGLRSAPITVTDIAGNTSAIPITGIGLAPSIAYTPGTIRSVAGNGTPGFSGDSSAAILALLNGPTSLVADSAGNGYIADTLNHVIRRIDAPTGIITTIAGTGTVSGYFGDTASATSAQLASPQGVALDTAGNVYIADTGNNRIREVNASTGIITSVAGNGAAAWTGDKGLATLAALNAPIDLAIDPTGFLYISDSGNNVIRQVSPSGIITTIAGTGAAGNTGDGFSATSATLTAPAGIAYNANGTVTFASPAVNVVRQINLKSGIITTVAGTGLAGFAGDGGPATSAQLQSPAAVAFDPAGDLYIADSGNSRVRRVDSASGYISTVAGTGTAGYTGDAASALAAQLNSPTGIALAGAANLYITDARANVVRKVDLSRGATIAFANQAPGITSPAQILAVTNSGNQPLSSTAINISANFQQLATSGTDCALSGVGALAPGSTCNIAVAFTPLVEGAFAGSIVATNNNLNLANATQTTQLTGAGVIPVTQLMLGGLALQTVAAAPQSISITAANNGVPVTVYTGTVAFTSSDPVAALPPNYTFTTADAGTHTFSTVVLASAGTQTFTATDTANSSLTASASTLVVAGAPAALSASAGSGQTAQINTVYPVLLAALVKDSVGNAVSGVTVTFTAPSTGASGSFPGSLTSVAAITDSTGAATSPLFTASPTPGSFSVTASASGAASTSFALQNIPGLVSTTLALAVAPTAPVYGQPLTFTASLSPIAQGAATAAGSIAFLDGKTQFDTLPLTGATAATSLPVPSAGTHTFTATYSGDANFASSTVTPAAVAVALAATSGSAAPLTLTYGQAGSATLTLAGQFTGAGIALPTGSVTYTIGTSTAASAALTATGTALLPIPATLTAGIYPVVATYAGDANYLAGGSTAFSLTILKIVPTVTLSSSLANVQSGTPVAFTATVTGGGTPVPYGDLRFFDGANLLQVQQIVQATGTAVLHALLAPGTHSITAMFVGAAGQYVTTTSAMLTVTVTGIPATRTTLTATPNAANNLNYDFASSVWSGSYAAPSSQVSLLDTTSGNATIGAIALSTPVAGFASLPGSPSVATGTTPVAIARGDFDNSGLGSTVVANQASNNLTILLGKNAGNPVVSTVAAGNTPVSVAVADLNGDGNQDIAVANRADNTVGILLGNGDGTFHAMATYPVGAPSGVAIADINQDGILDLIVSNRSDNTISVLTGKGDGTYNTQQTYAVGTQPAAVRTSDLNGTNSPSILVANQGTNTIGVLLNRGDGTAHSLPRSHTPSATVPHR